MCPRGGRCQVQGWGQSLPPGSDGSAGIPARGWGEGVVFSQFRANTFVSLGNLTSPWSWIHYTGLISALLQLSVVKAAARSVNSDMCTHGGARRGLPARGAPASAAFHLRGRHTGPRRPAAGGGGGAPPPCCRAGPEASALPPGPSGPPPRQPRGSDEAPPLHRSRGTGWAGAAEAMPESVASPAPGHGRCGGRERQLGAPRRGLSLSAVRASHRDPLWRVASPAQA